jgi:hypothetical protein
MTTENYSSRHDLHFGSEGFAFPSTLIKPLGSTIKIDWSPVVFPHQRIEFVGQGTAHISSVEFENAFANFLSSVTTRLTELGITDTLLQEEWKAILEVVSEERKFCEAAAALGLDPYSIDEESADTIVKVGDSLPKSLIGEFFWAADFSRLSEQLASLLEALKLSRSNPANLEPLKELRDTTQSQAKIAAHPWEQGYQFARQLRQQLNLNSRILRSFDDVSQALRVDTDELREAINPQIEHPNTFDAVVDVNSEGSPGFVITHKRPDALKFSLCRGLFEFLFSNAEEPFLVTKTRSERQKRNRAFATEFLLPAESLHERIKTEYVDEEVIEDLADEFGVSTYVVEYQLRNHRIAKTVPA